MAANSSDDYWEVIKTKKNHFKLLHNGFVYTKHKSFSNQTRWRCAKRGRCRGSLMTTNDFKELYPKLEHSHPPDEEYCQTMRTRFMSPPGSRIVFQDGNLLFKSTAEESASGSNQGIKLLQNEAGELIMVNETPTHFMNLLSVEMKHLVPLRTPRRILSDPIPMVLETSYSSFNHSSPCYLFTSKGGVKLCDEKGFRFTRNRVDGPRIYWNCERKKNQCKARAISSFDNSGVTFSLIEHNHPPPKNENGRKIKTFNTTRKATSGPLAAGVAQVGEGLGRISLGKPG